MPVTFGSPSNYRTEYIKFEVADLESPYHAIMGRPAIAKFMAILHYPYLLLKMPAPFGVLSIKGDLKKAFECDVQAVEIANKTGELLEKKELNQMAEETNPEELEIPAKKQAILIPLEEADVKHIDLQTGDPSKTAIISAHLSPK